MIDGWGFLVYTAIIPAILGGIISLLLFAFLWNFKVFAIFLFHIIFWLAWLFPYCLLLIIICFTRELDLLEFYICVLTLPIVYHLRKYYITASKKSERVDDFSIWIILMSILSLFVHLGMIALCLLLRVWG